LNLECVQNLPQTTRRGKHPFGPPALTRAHNRNRYPNRA